jgi:hypothetical protein
MEWVGGGHRLSFGVVHGCWNSLFEFQHLGSKLEAYA